jgi:hypothetical protein
MILTLTSSPDFGSCATWRPALDDLQRESFVGLADERVVAWQVNGDLSSNCIASNDVVTPGFTRQTYRLRSLFPTPASIVPSGSRSHLSYFRGGPRGYGALTRVRSGCDATSKDVLFQRNAEGKDYIETLGDSRFCLLPRGIGGWTSRTYDAIWMGCIPVFLADKVSATPN